MKAIIKICALLMALMMLCLTAVSCHRGGADVSTPDPSKSGSPSESIIDGNVFNILASGDLSVVSNGNVFELYVPNATTVLQLTKYVSVADGITWLVATDISMQELIVNKTVSLKEGVNTFYVYCHNATESVMENYVLNIHRTGSYLITFEGLDETQVIAEGGFAAQPAGTPIKEGYDFAGWNFDFTKPVTAPANIAAKWTPKTFVITYDPNFGTMSTLTQTVTYGEEVVLLTPEREGFVFADWFYGEECIKSGVWLIASDVTLTAHWASDSYTVTFNPNGGVMEGATVIVVSYGDAITFPIPTRDGFTFGGWYDGDTLCFDGIYEYTKDLNLTAKWNERSATLTFFENGGTKNSYTETLSFGAQLPIPEREGYTFGGWFSDEALTIAVTAVPDASMRLYAWWTEEGKPGEFIYEPSGLYYKVTERVDKDSNAVVPAYIGGRRTVDAIPRPNPNAGVVLEKETIEVKIDRTITVNATFIPRFEGDDLHLSFVSSRPSIAIVDEHGVVKGLQAGACVITVTNEASGMSADCIVIVSSKPKNENASLSLNTRQLTLHLGEKFTLHADYHPEYDDDSTVLTFSSTEPSVAEVDENGEITTLSVGECSILVSDSYGMMDACVLTVLTPEPGITVTVPVEGDIAVGWSITLEAVYIPENDSDDTTLVWDIDNNTIAKVDNGVITALAAGECVITVSSTDKKYTKQVTFTVREPGIYDTETELTLKIGEQHSLTGYLLPEKPDGDRTLTFTSENLKTARLDGNVLFALEEGSCTVKISSADGKYSVTVNITIKAE